MMNFVPLWRWVLRIIYVVSCLSSFTHSFLPSWGVQPSKRYRYGGNNFVLLSVEPHPPDTPPPEIILERAAHFAGTPEVKQEDDPPAATSEVELQDDLTAVTPEVELQDDPPAVSPEMELRDDAPAQTFSDIERLSITNEELMEWGSKVVDNIIKPMADIQNGVPAERIKGAAIVAAVLSVLAGKGVMVSSAASLSAAYLAISRGVTGDVLRTVGGIAWDVTDATARLVSILTANEKLNVLAKSVSSKAVEALKKNEINAKIFESARSSSTADASEINAAEQAFLVSQEDLDRVLKEAEAVIDEADAAIAKAKAMEDNLRIAEEYDVSVPYDAAAKLAYEESDKSMTFPDFQAKYLAEAVALVKSKQPVDLSIPYDAAAKLAYEESDKSMSFAEFRDVFRAEAVDLVKSKQAAKIKVADEARRIQEQERIADEYKWMAEQTEKEKLSEEVRLAEEGEYDDEEDDFFDDDEEDVLDDEDFLAAVELAQEGLEGKIVGVDEIIADSNSKAEWDAAGTFARELQYDDDDDDIDAVSDAFEGLDLEALGKAARDAVQSFENDMKEIDDAKDSQRQEWADTMVSQDKLSTATNWSTLTVAQLKEELKARGLQASGKKADLIAILERDDADRLGDDIDGEIAVEGGAEEDDGLEFDELDMEELGRQARAAVQMFQAGNSDFDDEPTEEMLAELESEMASNGELLGEPQVDFSSMTVAELKEECRNRGLKVSGKKVELIERLESAA